MSLMKQLVIRLHDICIEVRYITMFTYYDKYIFVILLTYYARGYNIYIYISF